MIGHERIIELRNGGSTPRAVFIDPICRSRITRSVASAVETVAMKSNRRIDDDVALKPTSLQAQLKTPSPRPLPREIDLGDDALPVVLTGDTEPAHADLSFVHGLRVHLGPFGEALTWHAWWDAIVEAGASHVYGCDPQTMEVFTWQR